MKYFQTNQKNNSKIIKQHRKWKLQLHLKQGSSKAQLPILKGFMMHSEIRVLELLKAKMQQKGYANTTRQHYIKWIREYIKFHKADPKKMGISEIDSFKKYLNDSYMFKTELKKQAIGAVYFLYTEVLGINLQNEYIQDMLPYKKRYVQSIMVF